MGFISEADSVELRKELGQIKEDLHLHFFSSKNEKICPLCEQTREILTEVQALSDKIELIEHDFDADPETAKKFNVEKLPAIVLTKTDDVNMGIRWFGIPAGHEFMSLIFALIDVGSDQIEIPDWAVDKIKEIDKPVHIQVFVTPT